MFSRVKYSGDGTTKLFSVPFPYMQKSDIEVTVDTVQTSEFEWISSHAIRLKTAPPRGKNNVDVRRNTAKATQAVSFKDGSTLTEQDLNTETIQLLFSAQEAIDEASTKMSATLANTWDAAGNRIENLADPVEKTDATTKKYVDSRDDAVKAYAEQLYASKSELGLFLPDGDGAVPRTFQDKQREALDLDDYETFALACRVAVAKGRYLRLPGRALALPAGTVIPGGVDIRGVAGQTSIAITGTGALVAGGPGISMRDVALSGGTNAFRTNGYGKHRITRCAISNTREHGIYCDSGRNIFEQLEVTGCGLTGIVLYGPNATRNKVTQCDVDSNGSFCIWVARGANRNELHGNSTVHGNVSELIGVTFDCWGNRITDNHAEGTLDNGISVTGYRNVVIGNVCNRNANHGIGIYGERNVVVGNTCKSNGQSNLSAASLPYAGISLTPAFGALARKNIVHSNNCDDDQPVKTQHYGIKVTVNSHIQWAPGAVITSATAFCFNGARVYRTDDLGVTGTVPPTHAVGTASDGKINWTVVATNLRTISDDLSNWAAGIEVAAGMFALAGSNVYSSESAGVTGGTMPSHMLGTASDGSVQWKFVEQRPNNLDAWDNSIGENTSTGNLVGPWTVQTSNAQQIKAPGMTRMSVQGRQLAADILTIAQNPEGAITASPGSIALRLDATLPGIALMSKQSGSGNVGWLPVAMRHQGLLANRPNLSALGNGVRGYTYWATDVDTHGAELKWHGTGWIDKSTGTLYPPN